MLCLEHLSQELNFTHLLQTSFPLRALPVVEWVHVTIFREELTQRSCIPGSTTCLSVVTEPLLVEPPAPAHQIWVFTISRVEQCRVTGSWAGQTFSAPKKQLNHAW